MEPFFDFPVAVRYATTDQENLLVGELCFINKGYPFPPYSQMKGFTSTQYSMYADQVTEVMKTNRGVFRTQRNDLK